MLPSRFQVWTGRSVHVFGGYLDGHQKYHLRTEAVVDDERRISRRPLDGPSKYPSRLRSSCWQPLLRHSTQDAQFLFYLLSTFPIRDCCRQLSIKRGLLFNLAGRRPPIRRQATPPHRSCPVPSLVAALARSTRACETGPCRRGSLRSCRPPSSR